MSSYLIIEDNSGIGQKLAREISSLGHQVDATDDGLTGLSQIEKRSDSGTLHDGIILDMDLPDIDSWKVLQFLRTAHPELGVVVLSETGKGEKADNARKMPGVALAEGTPDGAEILKLFETISIPRQTHQPRPVEPESSREKNPEGYALVKISQRDLFLEVFRKIYSIEGVTHCNATRGAYDLIVRMQGKDREKLDKTVSEIAGIEGVGGVDFAPIRKPHLSKDLGRIISRLDRFFKAKGCQCGSPEVKEDQECRCGSPEVQEDQECQCGSYALLEVQKDHFEEVFRRVYFWDNVISCETLEGPFQMSLLLKSATREKLEDIVNDKISPMNGVLRAIQCPIVQVTE